MAMVRRAWRLKVREGQEQEYKRRHQEIWPELLEVLKTGGATNYSIFMDGTDVFLYAEMDTEARQPPEGRAIGERWLKYMSDITVRDVDPATGRPRWLEEVFHLD